MNTYTKFAPNVFLAKCTEIHVKGETIHVETKYGKENDCIVFNLIAEKEGNYYYSIIRADGYNQQEHAKSKAMKLQNASNNATNKSNEYWKASNEGKDFLVLGEPIKIGHHSEKRHRALIERNTKRFEKSIEMSDKAEEYESKVSYWSAKANVMNLSMPESLEFYEFELEKAKAKHEGLKNGTIERNHGFSLTYAKKEVNDIESKLKLAKRLWE